LEPGLALTDPETPVAWFPQEAWVDPVAMTNRLVEATRHAGGRVLTGPEREVTAIGVEGGRVSSLTLKGGQTNPDDTVVNSAGVEGAHVAALLGRILPLAAPRGLAMRAESPDGSDPLDRPVRTDHIFLRPNGPGGIYLIPRVDLGDTPPGPIPLDDPRVSEAMTWAAAAVPALAAARPIAAIVAPWPLIDDGLPCVGRVLAIPGYFEAVTDYGIALAPLIARSLADEIVGKPGDALFAPFSPERFSGA
ncbi:MAG: NAD(P)/FAD-dependent oxidoreductase, partial [Thermomicrobiales bacterium]